MLLRVATGLRGVAEARGEHIVAAHRRARTDGEIIATCFWTVALISNAIFPDALHSNNNGFALAGPYISNM